MVRKPKLPTIPSPRQTKAIRNWLGQTQGDFATNCSVSLSALMDYEKGNRATSEEVRLAIGIYVQILELKFIDGAVALPE